MVVKIDFSYVVSSAVVAAIDSLDVRLGKTSETHVISSGRAAVQHMDV